MRHCTREEFIEKADRIHNHRYDYSEVRYVNSKTKVDIICPEHGMFQMTPNSHIQGEGCPKCSGHARRTREDFIAESIKKHGDKYGYDEVEFDNMRKKVKIYCRTCKEYFWQAPHAHIRGDGCPKCAGTMRKTTEEFIEGATKKHNGKYDYSKSVYVNSHTPVTIICSTHGEFCQYPYTHLRGEGCPECGEIARREGKRLTKDEFIEKADKIHNGKYDYSAVDYVNGKKKVKIICPKHGEFLQIPNNHLNGNGCPACAQELRDSKSEREIYEFIRENYNGEIFRHRRDIIESRQELDIYLPDLGIAIEFDGLYFHGELMQPLKEYHLKKTLECLKKGIRLIHIFEDEWLHKKEVVKSLLLQLIIGAQTTLYSNNCVVREVDCDVAEGFLSKNHIMGACDSCVRYGLYYSEELVSLMAFGYNKENGEYELLRFCDKLNTNVVGGSKKLFKYFTNENKPKQVVSYADRRWYDGSLEEGLGFSLTRETGVSYFYVKKDVRLRADDKRAIKGGYFKIYDCGSLLYTWKSVD